MTKRINMNHEHSSETAPKTRALLPLVLLFGICAAWAGFAYPPISPVEFPRSVKGGASQLDQWLDRGAAELRAFLDGYLYR